MDTETLKTLYDRFNARDIDGILAAVVDDVVWARGIEGGYVQGREALREYWMHQLAMINPHDEPVSFDRATDGSIVVTVQQTVRDLEGRPLQDQTHRLHDKVIRHTFHFQKGKIVRFDAQDVPQA